MSVYPQFSPFEVALPESSVECAFYMHKADSGVVLIRLSGVCGVGSVGDKYSRYLYQRIGAGLLYARPFGVIVDMRDLEYTFGDGMISAFEIFSHINFFDEGQGIATAFVLSDKNKHGLSSLWGFDIKNPREGIFYNLDNAEEYILKKMDEI